MNLSSLVQIDEGLVFAVLLSAWVVYRVVRFLLLRRLDILRELLLSLAFIYGCAVFHLTFFPMAIVLYAFDPYDSNLVPLVGMLRMLQYVSPASILENLGGNLVLLAPLGFLLPVFLKPLRGFAKMLLAGFLVSLSIELTQLFLAVRIFDVDDLLLNTLGVLLGFGFFLLLSRISLLSRLFEKIAGPPRPGQLRVFSAYALAMLLAFLSIYAYQIMRQTATQSDILNALPGSGQAALGAPKFGPFLYVLAQSEQGQPPSYALYRRVFFNRYTILEWGDLQLPEGQFSVSGMSIGHAMHYFIIARTQKDAASLVSGDLRFPVQKAGDYAFSTAQFPLHDRPERFHSFRFVDSQGHDLALSQVK